MQLTFPVTLRIDVIMINHFVFVKYLKYFMLQNIKTCLFLVTQVWVKAVSNLKFYTVWKLKQLLLSSFWHGERIALYIILLLSVASGGVADASQTMKRRQNLAQTTGDELLAPTSTANGDGRGGCLASGSDQELWRGY